MPGLDTALAGKQATLSSAADVPGLSAALAAKQDALTGIADVPGLSTALAGKQSTLSGTSDVPELDSALAGKQATLLAYAKYGVSYFILERARSDQTLSALMPRQHLESTSDRYMTMEVCGASLSCGVRRMDKCAPRVSLLARCVSGDWCEACGIHTIVLITYYR